MTWCVVELGVWRGDFSRPFFDRWQGRKLFLVDPWDKLPDDEYDDVRNRDFDTGAYLHVLERFADEISNERVVILKMKSHDALEHFDDGSVDLVYVDANHAYEHVLHDCTHWYQKVRPGGILAGHDLFEPEHCGVTEAVREFCVSNGLVCNVIAGDFIDTDGRKLFGENSWYVVKPD